MLRPQQSVHCASSSRYDLYGKKSFMSASALRAAGGTLSAAPPPSISPSTSPTLNPGGGGIFARPAGVSRPRSDVGAGVPVPPCCPGAPGGQGGAAATNI